MSYSYDRTAAAKEEYVILDDNDKKKGSFKTLDDAVAEAGSMLAKKRKGSLRVMFTSPTPEFWTLTLQRTH